MRNILACIVISIFIFTKCKKVTKDLQKNDAWEQILEAVEKKDIDYLLSYSSDSLQCVECSSGKSWVLKDTFFKKHFNQMQLMKNKDDYSYFIEDISNQNKNFQKKIRITYKQEYEGNKYDIIYTLLKNEESFMFFGVFSIP